MSQTAHIRWANVGRWSYGWINVGVGSITLVQRWANVIYPIISSPVRPDISIVGPTYTNTTRILQCWRNVGPTLVYKIQFIIIYSLLYTHCWSVSIVIYYLVCWTVDLFLLWYTTSFLELLICFYSFIIPRFWNCLFIFIVIYYLVSATVDLFLL